MKKTLLLFTFLSAGICVHADDVLPRRPDFAVYSAMLVRSPFAVATAAAPVQAPDFARDLYVANAARLQDGDMVTIASTTDRNFKEYLSTKGANENGYAINDIKWSDRLGETKVTITKDGQLATLTFNQALLSAPMANTGGQPIVNAIPQAIVPQPMVQPPTPYINKPAPIPSLPPAVMPNVPQAQAAPNRFRSRGVIQRNPNFVPTPVPTPVAPADDQE